MKPGSTTFATAIGAVQVAFSERGITRIRLLSSHRGGAHRAVEDGSLPEALREPIQRLRLHLEGKPQDLTGVVLDYEGVPPFHRRVYEEARRIPPGRTRSYSELALRAGSPGAARAVGQAMARNPFPIVVPCHRVLAAGGRPGGFSAPGGVGTKLRLLALEGVAGVGG
jgi:methylated-DNA-[protein]-cysteine S-methyltransferase